MTTPLFTLVGSRPIFLQMLTTATATLIGGKLRNAQGETPCEVGEDSGEQVRNPYVPLLQAAHIYMEEESIPDRVESYARKTAFDYPSATPLTPT
jgi:hypothetical protein